MSLTEVKQWDIVKKQVNFKLKAYMGIFTTLLTVQIIALLLSSGGTGMMGTSSGDLSITLHYYSGSMIIAFTMIWSLISAIIITTKSYRNDDFTFITNRSTSNLSNILFLFVASIIGGATAFLAGNLQRVLLYYFVTADNIIYVEYSFKQLVIGIIATILYIFLFAAFGYLIGTITQLSKIFVFLIPAIIFGSMFIQVRKGEEATFIVNTVNFFFQETSLALFALKIVASTVIMFIGALVMTNRLEVK